MNKNNIEVSWLKTKINTPSAQGIALDVANLINTNEIPSGSQLPPLRELAEKLGVSPATVSMAWSTLRKRNMISGFGKTGIIVMDNNKINKPLRFANLDTFIDLKNSNYLDLSYHAIDPQLLPNLKLAMNHAITVKDLNNPQCSTITDSLKSAITPDWPYPADAFLALNSNFEGFILLLKTILLPGTTIAVEDPTSISLLDLLKKHDIKIIPVACDDDGPLPNELSKALKRKPMAFIYQPRTQDSLWTYCQ